jgi:hypothetical protein
MGKFLEMMIKTPIIVLALAMSLTGCGSEKSNEVSDSLLGLVAKSINEARRGPKAAPDLGPGPAIQAKFANLGLDLRMVALDRDGDVTIWHDGQGHQIATRNGLLIWTRGFGGDLMSAKVPAPGAIRLGNQYQRLNVYVDGTSNRFDRPYDCTVEAPPEPDLSTPGQHLREVCEGPVGKIKNDFWMKGGQILRSRQWVSATFGHVDILPL